MNSCLSKDVLLGVGLAVLLAGQPGFAGDESVDFVSPVFVPQFILPEPGPVAGLNPGPVIVATSTISPVATQAIVDALGDATQFCASLPDQEYAVDCLSYRLSEIARSLPATGDYADVKTALATAAGKLNTLARKNADPALPRARARNKGAAANTASRPLIPVRADAQADVNAQAAAILDEAQTVLLRSSQGSEERRIPYQQIAAAVNSNKILLRSL